MANPYEQLASVAESLQFEENDDYVEDLEEMGTSCSSGPCLRGCSNNNGAHRYLLQQQQRGQKRENWFVTKMRRVKQFSEVLGRTKWTNFIRSLSLRRVNKKGYLLLQQCGHRRENRIVDKMRQIKQFSEVLLGVPKWKNLIGFLSLRRIDNKKRNQFQYDPHSYSLNFDDGIN